MRCVFIGVAGCPQVVEACVPEPPRCDTHPGSSDGTYLDAGGATLSCALLNPLVRARYM